MKVYFCVLAVLSLSAIPVISQKNDEDEDDILSSFKQVDREISWQEYKQLEGRTYPENEDRTREKWFYEVEQHIIQHNKKFKSNKTSFFTTINDFTDLTPREKNELLGLHFNPQINQTRRLISSKGFQFGRGRPIFYIYSANGQDLPASVNYRRSLWADPIRNQGKCGSCWAFAASSVMSFYVFNRTRKNLIFSPQNLIDCSNVYGNIGCNGGWPPYAFEFVVSNKQTLEENYRYMSSQGGCNQQRLKTAPLFGAKSFVLINPDERSLKQAVAKLGPVVVGIDADLLFYYGKGIWDGTFGDEVCNPNNINHAVVIVGYNTIANQSYWIIKNSWGSSWGERGYFRMKMDGTNLCGILSAASTII